MRFPSLFHHISTRLPFRIRLQFDSLIVSSQAVIEYSWEELAQEFNAARHNLVVLSLRKWMVTRLTPGINSLSSSSIFGCLPHTHGIKASSHKTCNWIWCISVACQFTFCSEQNCDSRSDVCQHFSWLALFASSRVSPLDTCKRYCCYQASSRLLLLFQLSFSSHIDFSRSHQNHKHA